MGSFIPTPHDQEIVARLNWVFHHHRTVINNHRDHPQGGGGAQQPLLPAASLSRLARRIGAYPQSTQAQAVGGLKNPRARWFVFLDGLPNQTKTDINTVITAALQNNAPIIFDLTHEPNPPQPAPYVIMASPGQPMQVTLPNGQPAYCLTLVCQTPIQESNQAIPPGTPGTPGTFNNPTSHANAQANEVGINIPWNPDNTNY
ncbi:hypothetical protein [Bradyrhizobium guangzhouense]|uniref:hypothetical protein n=1 Tax=Bradyrhizobium guangzhouense TaxID=1325095 RepID=UPI0010099B2F|nr:hypothetical protein [Bradyrhizobium guangzhouense]